MLPQELKNAKRYSAGEAIWGIGMGFIAPLTVMPLLLKQLGAGPVELGFFYSMASAGFLLTQPLGMFLSRHGAGKKRFMLIFNAAVTLPVFVFMSTVLFMLGAEEQRHLLARQLLLGAFTLRMLSVGVVLPIWQDWINGLFETKSRGKVTGIYAAASAFGVMAGTFLAARIGLLLPFPVNYAILFIAASIFFSFSFGAFTTVESGTAPLQETVRPSISELISRFSLSLKDANFAHYLIGRLLLTMGGVAVSFFAVHFQSPEGGGLSEAAIIGMGAFIMLPQGVSSYWLGQIGDRHGHRRGVIIGAFAQVSAIFFAFAGRGLWACFSCFILLGVAYAAGWVSHQNFIYETCPHDNRIAHITLSNLILAPIIILMPVGAGALISRLGMLYGIGICLLISITGAAYLWFFVADPRLIIIGQKRRRMPAWLRMLRRRHRD